MVGDETAHILRSETQKLDWWNTAKFRALKLFGTHGCETTDVKVDSL